MEKKKYEFKWWHAVVGFVGLMVLSIMLFVVVLTMMAGGPPGSKAWHDFAQQLIDK